MAKTIEYVKKEIYNTTASNRNPLYDSHIYWSQKPYNICDILIDSFSEEGDTVFDPFLGSGVTLLQAISNANNRRAVNYQSRTVTSSSTLTLSAAELTYKKGRKVVNIPLNSILSIDFCANGIIVAVPHVKFKFAQLKNKKEVYDALYEQTNAPSGVTTTTVIAPTQSLTAMAAPLLANPTLEGKLAYFGKLREAGLITKQQYDKYIDQSYKADC